VVEHAAVVTASMPRLPGHEPGSAAAAFAKFHAGWHDPIAQIIDGRRDIVVTDTLDVATLPTWSRSGRSDRRRRHATSPHARPGRVRSRWKTDAAWPADAGAQEFGRLTGFQNFEAERRPRAEKIVALARRNGNSKREFSPTGAWIRKPDDEANAAARRAGNGLMYALRSPRAYRSRRADYFSTRTSTGMIFRAA